MKKLLITIVIVLVVVFAGLLVAGLIAFRKTGQIAVDPAGVRLTIRGALGLGATIGPTTEAQAVKAGVYRPAQLYRTLDKQIVSDDGSKATESWQLSGGGPWGDLATIEVEKGKTTVVKFDGPLTAKVDATYSNVGDGATASLALQLVGPHGEQYSPLVKKDGKTVDAPKFAILDEAGKELHTGRFEYG
jgi:hypothetical protein